MHRAALFPTLLAATYISLTPHLAYSQADFLNSEQSLGLIHNASIEVFDDVTGGCWTNIESITQKARLTLEQSGINTYLERLSDHYPSVAKIYIEAFGKRSDASTCYGSIEVAVGDTSSRKIGDTYLLGSIYFYRSRSVAIGYSLNEPFAQMVEDSINKLAADIISGRRDDEVKSVISAHEESLTAEPETWEEWKKRMSFPDTN